MRMATSAAHREKIFSGCGDLRGRRWDYNSDHILTAKRHDRGRPSLVRPSFPAETRQSHPARRRFSDAATIFKFLVIRKNPSAETGRRVAGKVLNGAREAFHHPPAKPAAPPVAATPVRWDQTNES